MGSKNREPVRIFGSNPDYEEINHLSDRIALVKNPHMNFGFTDADMPEAERKAVEATLKDRLQELLDFQRLPFNKFLINRRI